MDFANLPPPSKDRTLVTYGCAKCGEVDEYAYPMPEGWRHEVGRNGGRCDGLLVEVLRRTVP